MLKLLNAVTCLMARISGVPPHITWLQRHVAGQANTTCLLPCDNVHTFQTGLWPGQPAATRTPAARFGASCHYPRQCHDTFSCTLAQRVAARQAAPPNGWISEASCVCMGGGDHWKKDKKGRAPHASFNASTRGRILFRCSSASSLVGLRFCPTTDCATMCAASLSSLLTSSRPPLPPPHPPHRRPVLSAPGAHVSPAPPLPIHFARLPHSYPLRWPVPGRRVYNPRRSPSAAVATPGGRSRARKSDSSRGSHCSRWFSAQLVNCDCRSSAEFLNMR